jgi:mannose-6-phosphate isomerase
LLARAVPEPSLPVSSVPVPSLTAHHWSDRLTQTGQVYKATRVSKPWGHELIFAAFDGLYVGKVIRVKAGESLSLQYHHEKTETICVVEGRARVDFGDDDTASETVELEAGDVIHLPASVRHRVFATEDLLLVEASTATPGWTHDVVRLEDRYGRSGTSAP